MVLENHIRKGKKFIPPLLAMATPLQETRWHVERLPEFFWLGFITQRVGVKNTLELAYEMDMAISRTIKEMRGAGPVFRSYALSEHLSCTDDERSRITSAHANSAWLKALTPHLSDMAIVWNDLPLAYLVPPPTTSPDKDLVREVKALLGKCSHRHDKDALIIQANVVALEGRTGKMPFAYGLNIPDLNAIFDYPETEDSHHAAGFAVTTCGSLMLRPPSEEPDLRWRSAFWNACFRLDGCEYRQIYE